MRILFVSHYATPHIGGVETVIRSLRRELRRRGHDVVAWPDFEFDAGGLAIAMDLAVPAERRVLAAAADPRRSGYALGR